MGHQGYRPVIDSVIPHRQTRLPIDRAELAFLGYEFGCAYARRRQSSFRVSVRPLRHGGG